MHSAGIHCIALQVVDDHVACPVGSIPCLAVAYSPECGDTDMHMVLFKVRDTGLCLLGQWLRIASKSSIPPLCRFAPSILTAVPELPRKHTPSNQSERRAQLRISYQSSHNCNMIQHKKSSIFCRRQPKRTACEMS